MTTPWTPEEIERTLAILAKHSWVYGEAGLRNHPITHEQAAAIVDKHDAEKQQQFAAARATRKIK